MFCWHSWGPIQGSGHDRYQYCAKCHKARLLPCSHKWKTIREGPISRFNREVGYTYIKECEFCGEVIFFQDTVYNAID